MHLLRSRIASILAFAAFGLCSLLDHTALMTGTPLAAGLAFLQLCFVGAFLLWRVPYRHKWLAGGLLCLVLAVFFWRTVQPSLVVASALPHTVAQLGLLSVFLTSPPPGREDPVSGLPPPLPRPTTHHLAPH